MPTPSGSRFIVSPRVAAFFDFVEKYVISLVFVYFTYREYRIVLARLPLVRKLVTVLGPRGIYYYPTFIQHALLMVMQGFSGLVLLINAAPAKEPEDYRDIAIPFAVTFFFLAYNLVGYVPAPLRRDLFPASLHSAMTSMALALTVVGYLVSIWSIICLGRSFAILVSVRQVVGRGPYHYVRHPIYFGYICIVTGYLLNSFSAIVLLLTVTVILLTIYRARLEEDRLGDFSPEYREYMKRTGFLFPRLRRASS